jgi:NADH:ubiquinone oxidoreductase subunit 3 (subunit A)
MPDTISTLTAVATVIIATMAFYILAGRLGKTSEGTGTKYSPFTGGEEIPVSRGKYHSDLFVYAALFMVFEVFGLLLASAIDSLNLIWPLVFTATGGLAILVILVWFVHTGGSELA